MSEILPVDKFFKNMNGLSIFIHDLISRLHKQGHTKLDPSLISFASGLVSSMDKVYIIESFIRHSHFRQCYGLDQGDSSCPVGERCTSKAYYGVPGGKAEYCHKHKKEGMHNLFPDDETHDEVVSQPHHWDKIKKRDEDFMAQHAFSIFRIVPENNVNAFKDAFLKRDDKGQLIIDKEDRDVIWDYLDAFVKIAIQYVHDRREPAFRNGKYTYHVRFVDSINTVEHSKKWNIQGKLQWPEKK
jgi:hypothetical protein